MKLLLLFFFQVVLSQEPNYIKEFHSVKGKEFEVDYIKKYKSISNVSIRAYVISLQMKQAKYFWSPLNKLAVFNRGKKELELLINKYSTNIHLRYVRLLIQENVPGILGYSSSIGVDKKILKSYLNKIDETDYLDKYIRKNTTL